MSMLGVVRQWLAAIAMAAVLLLAWQVCLLKGEISRVRADLRHLGDGVRRLGAGDLSGADLFCRSLTVGETGRRPLFAIGRSATSSVVMIPGPVHCGSLWVEASEDMGHALLTPGMLEFTRFGSISMPAGGTIALRFSDGKTIFIGRDGVSEGEAPPK